MKELIVSLDLEMNQPSGRIIQIGAVLGNVRTGEIVSRLSVFVNPGEQLAPRIIELTGIQPADVEGAPGIADGYRVVERWLAPYGEQRWLNPVTWGGGDSQTLREQVEVALGTLREPTPPQHDEAADTRERGLFGRRWIDAKTLFVAWNMAHGREARGGLRKSLKSLGMRFEGRPHNALDDAFNTFLIYRRLLAEFQQQDFVSRIVA